MGFWSEQSNVVDADKLPRRAVRKDQIPTKLDKAEAKKKALALDARKLAEWAKQVKARDGWKDRMTGTRVTSTHLSLAPDSAQAHHVEPRSNPDTRYDVRNGITLSFRTHDLVERNKVRIVGTVWFTVNGKRYVNCDHLVRFVEVKY